MYPQDTTVFFSLEVCRLVMLCGEKNITFSFLLNIYRSVPFPGYRDCYVRVGSEITFFFFLKKPPVPIVLECHFEPVCEICALFTFGEIGKNNKPMRHKNTAPLTATKITAGPTSESESSIVAAVKYKQ